MSTPSVVLEQCVGYPLALALQDVLPVVLGAFGYWWLTRRVERDVPVAGAPMRAAVILLVVTSLLAGPVRKTAAWLSDVAICPPEYDVPFSELQIPFVAVLAPGFAILSWGVLSALRGHVVRFWPFLIPLVLAVVVAVAYDRRSALFGAGGLWAAFLAVLLVILALRSHDRLSAGLFVVYGIGTLVLPALAGRGSIADTAAQWEAQGVNTVTQAALAWGALRLLRHGRSQGSPPGGPPAAG
jgi:hypothetical protein